MNDNLKVKTEQLLKEHKGNRKTYYERDLEGLINDLSVYQTELQMQNEELRGAHATINQNKDKYYTLFNLSPAGYFTLDENLMIQKVNQMGSRMLLRNVNTLEQTRITKYIDSNFQDQFYLFIQKILKTHAKQTTEIKILNSKQTSFHVQIDGYYLREFSANNDYIIFLSLTDISERIANEESLRKQNEELKKLNNELDKFTYSTSHDLRAPLASVLGLINLIRVTGNDSEKTQYVDLIEKSVKKLDHLIHEILDYSRNSRIETSSEIVNLESLFEEVFDGLAYMENYQMIKKEIEIKSAKPFFSDRKRLAVIFNNLISNSVKYRKPRHEDSYIRVTATIGKNAVIKIKDNGQGIAQHHLPKIFEMFYRANDRIFGSGLGLYLVSETVAKLNGTIEVNSNFGYGTEFTIVIPNLNP